MNNGMKNQIFEHGFWGLAPRIDLQNLRLVLDLTPLKFSIHQLKEERYAFRELRRVA